MQVREGESLNVVDEWSYVAVEGGRHDGPLVPVCLTEISILTYSSLLSPTLT